jgi:hypothetical protein
VHQDDGDRNDEQQRRPAGDAFDLRKARVDDAIEPAQLAKVKQLRREPLDGETDQ